MGNLLSSPEVNLISELGFGWNDEKTNDAYLKHIENAMKAYGLPDLTPSLSFMAPLLAPRDISLTPELTTEDVQLRQMKRQNAKKSKTKKKRKQKKATDPLFSLWDSCMKDDAHHQVSPAPAAESDFPPLWAIFAEDSNDEDRDESLSTLRDSVGASECVENLSLTMSDSRIHTHSHAKPTMPAFPSCSPSVPPHLLPAYASSFLGHSSPVPSSLSYVQHRSHTASPSLATQSHPHSPLLRPYHQCIQSLHSLRQPPCNASDACSPTPPQPAAVNATHVNNTPQPAQTTQPPVTAVTCTSAETTTRRAPGRARARVHMRARASTPPPALGLLPDLLSPPTRPGLGFYNGLATSVNVDATSHVPAASAFSSQSGVRTPSPCVTVSVPLAPPLACLWSLQEGYTWGVTCVEDIGALYDMGVRGDAGAVSGKSASVAARATHTQATAVKPAASMAGIATAANAGAGTGRGAGACGELLGAGGQGSVVRARCRVTGREVAVKVLVCDDGDDDDGDSTACIDRDYALRDVSVSHPSSTDPHTCLSPPPSHHDDHVRGTGSRVRRPLPLRLWRRLCLQLAIRGGGGAGVLPVCECLWDGRRAYVVMPLCEARDLLSFATRNHGLSLPRAAALARRLTQVVQSLTAEPLWSDVCAQTGRAVVHWDVKPANILWASRDQRRGGVRGEMGREEQGERGHECIYGCECGRNCTPVSPHTDAPEEHPLNSDSHDSHELSDGVLADDHDEDAGGLANMPSGDVDNGTNSVVNASSSPQLSPSLPSLSSILSSSLPAQIDPPSPLTMPSPWRAPWGSGAVLCDWMHAATLRPTRSHVRGTRGCQRGVVGVWRHAVLDCDGEGYDEEEKHYAQPEREAVEAMCRLGCSLTHTDVSAGACGNGVVCECAVCVSACALCVVCADADVCPATVVVEVHPHASMPSLPAPAAFPVSSSSSSSSFSSSSLVSLALSPCALLSSHWLRPAALARLRTLTRPYHLDVRRVRTTAWPHPVQEYSRQSTCAADVEDSPDEHACGMSASFLSRASRGRTLSPALLPRVLGMRSAHAREGWCACAWSRYQHCNTYRQWYDAVHGQCSYRGHDRDGAGSDAKDYDGGAVGVCDGHVFNCSAAGIDREETISRHVYVPSPHGCVGVHRRPARPSVVLRGVATHTNAGIGTPSSTDAAGEALGGVGTGWDACVWFCGRIQHDRALGAGETGAACVSVAASSAIARTHTLQDFSGPDAPSTPLNSRPYPPALPAPLSLPAPPPPFPMPCHRAPGGRWASLPWEAIAMGVDSLGVDTWGVGVSVLACTSTNAGVDTVSRLSGGGGVTDAWPYASTGADMRTTPNTALALPWSEHAYAQAVGARAAAMAERREAWMSEVLLAVRARETAWAGQRTRERHGCERDGVVRVRVRARSLPRGVGDRVCARDRCSSAVLPTTTATSPSPPTPPASLIAARALLRSRLLLPPARPVAMQWRHTRAHASFGTGASTIMQARESVDAARVRAWLHDAARATWLNRRSGSLATGDGAWPGLPPLPHPDVARVPSRLARAWGACVLSAQPLQRHVALNTYTLAQPQATTPLGGVGVGTGLVTGVRGVGAWRGNEMAGAFLRMRVRRRKAKDVKLERDYQYY